MKPPTLKAWLRKWRRRSYLTGRCFEACRDGLRRFPDLRAVVGITSRRSPLDLWDFFGIHCWLVDSSGAIVDPTAGQYGLNQDELDYWPFLVQPEHPETAMHPQDPPHGDADSDHLRAVEAFLLRECGWSLSRAERAA